MVFVKTRGLKRQDTNFGATFTVIKVLLIYNADFSAETATCFPIKTFFLRSVGLTQLPYFLLSVISVKGWYSHLYNTYGQIHYLACNYSLPYELILLHSVKLFKSLERTYIKSSSTLLQIAETLELMRLRFHNDALSLTCVFLVVNRARYLRIKWMVFC